MKASFSFYENQVAQPESLESWEKQGKITKWRRLKRNGREKPQVTEAAMEKQRSLPV